MAHKRKVVKPMRKNSSKFRKIMQENDRIIKELRAANNHKYRFSRHAVETL